MKTYAILASLSFASLLFAGCAGTEADVAEGTVDSTAESPLVLNGQTVNWTYVGNPSSANRIAVCRDNSSVLYALNNDYTLYSGNGTDSGWTYRGHPSGARDIACTSQSWIWALNADKTFYYNVSSGNDAKWVYEGTAGYAEQFGTGSLITALNYDDKVYTYDNSSKAWSYRATFPGATEAASANIGNYSTLRWFVVKNGDVNFTTGNSTALTAFPIVAGGVRKVVRDVSAGRSDEVWALTEERKLYKARFVETSCRDGVDNDSDAAADGYDSDCKTTLGQQVCAAFARSGSFCISRLGTGSNSLAVCNGSTLASTQTGDWCQTIGSGGSDYVDYIH